MNTKATNTLVEQISNYADNDVIIRQLEELAEEMKYDLDYPSDKIYWIKESISQMEGMFELLMDIKKSQLVESISGSKGRAARAGALVTVEDLELTVRTTHVLAASGIDTLHGLLLCSDVDLLKLPNLGTTSLNEIIDGLLRHNMALKECYHAECESTLDQFEFSPLTSDTLIALNIQTIADIRSYTLVELLSLKGITKKMVTEITDKFNSRGLSVYD